MSSMTNQDKQGCLYKDALIVPQRSFAIAKAGSPIEALDTRGINFCTGIAMVDTQRGIAALGHFDAPSFISAWRMLRRVREEAGNDLSGFQVHVVHGLKNWHLWMLMLVGFAALLMGYVAQRESISVIGWFSLLAVAMLGLNRVALWLQMQIVWPRHQRSRPWIRHEPIAHVLWKKCGIRIGCTVDVEIITERLDDHTESLWDSQSCFLMEYPLSHRSPK
ncbi:MAG: hypothetical protein O9327_02230 [Polaromonas sp.]|nr:hypothetical protein [Polaromonas sp.]